MEFKVFERLWWATPVWECPVTDIDNKAIAEYCYKVRDEKPGVTISNRGGWHSGELILPLPSDLEKLFNDLTVFVNDVTARYTGSSDLVLGNWWININGNMIIIYLTTIRIVFYQEVIMFLFLSRIWETWYYIVEIVQSFF